MTNTLTIDTFRVCILRLTFLLTLLSAPFVNVESQVDTNNIDYLTIKIKFNKAASYFIEGDSAITYDDLKSILSEESSGHLSRFERLNKKYKVGRQITTAGFVLIPLGYMGDKLLWNKKDKTSYYKTQNYPSQSSSTYVHTEKGKNVYVGRIIGGSVFLVGLIARSNAIAELEDWVNEYNTFKISLSPTYGLSKFNNSSIGLSLCVNF